jgi:Fe-S-cluster containining protein
MTERIQQARLDLETPYAFACQRCRRCCHAKRIQVNPYEVARLAGHFGVSTTAFLRRHTRDGAFLKFDADNTCPFLTGDGCGVHGDRPLVCRLYPLGRHVAETGEEWFTEVEAEEGCAGRRGAGKPLRAYLEEQGAAPFMRAADLYLALYWKLSALSETAGCGGPGRAPVTSWADLDAAVGRYCRANRLPVPETADEKMLLHIRAIETWAETPLKGGTR